MGNNLPLHANKDKHRRIFFNAELHKYTDQYNNVYTSVTTLIGKVEQEFDREYWLAFSVVKESGYKPTPDIENRKVIIFNKAYSINDIRNGKVKLKITTEELDKRWQDINKEACDRGNEIHNFLEDNIKLFSKTGEEDIIECVKINLKGENEHEEYFVYKDKVVNVNQLNNSDIKYKYPDIYKYLAKLIEEGYILYSEIRVYIADYLVAGTIDILAVKGSKFRIVDWKTNKDKLMFKSGYFKKVNNIKTDEFVYKRQVFKKPLDHLEQCKGMIYTLQLSLYAYIVESWGLKLEYLVLYHIRPKIRPERYKIQYLKEDAKLLLEYNINPNMAKKQTKEEKNNSFYKLPTLNFKNL